MMIWLLALVLMAALGALGYRQGGVRVAFSLVGILLGVLLAMLLGRFIKPVLGGVGLKNPLLVWALAPFVVFVLVSILAKVGGFSVHHKVDVFFKYKAGDLRLALYERLNHRLGLCLGLVNGAVYFILISFVIYAFSYWTIQTQAEGDSKPVSILNRLGADLESSGFIKVANAISSLPPSYFDTADVAGIVYTDPLTEARLTRYPAFLGLAEKPEFQTLESDQEFNKMRMEGHKPIKELLDYQNVRTIVNNPDLLKEIWATVSPDVNDLRQYLETGRSPKYEPETILGRWDFDVSAAMRSMHASKPNISSSDMQRMKKYMSSAFAKTSLVAMTDHKLILKNLPALKPGAAGNPQTVEGQWKNEGGKYEISSPIGELSASVEGDHLVIKGAGTDLAFNRED